MSGNSTYGKDTGEVFIAGINDTWLGDVIGKIPSGVLLNKGKTGCGGTELELSTKRHSIVAVPCINMIYNKTLDEHRPMPIIGVYGDIGDQQILDYLQDDSIVFKKVLVTYHSLPRVLDLIRKSNIGLDGKRVNPFNSYFLLVDEYHNLCLDYKFKSVPVLKILKLYKQFKDFAFMTATPVDLLIELKHLPVVTVQWMETRQQTVELIVASSPYRRMLREIKKKLAGKELANLHIFLNSPPMIVKAIAESGLLPHQVKIVCSENEKNKIEIKKLGSGYEIERDFTKPKLVNFITSTAFEGADMFDRDGKTYIVSDRYQKGMKYDIKTSFTQICGRIRDSRYKDKIYFIAPKSFEREQITYEQFLQDTEASRKRQEDIIKGVNALPLKTREGVIPSILKDEDKNPFLATNGEHSLRLDANLVSLHRMKFKIHNQIYSCIPNLSQELQANGYKVRNTSKSVSDRILITGKPTASFEKACHEYNSVIQEEGLGNQFERSQLLEENYPMIKKAFEIIGYPRLQALKFRLETIRNILERHKEPIDDPLFIYQLSLLFPLNEPIPKSEVVTKLKMAYKRANIAWPSKVQPKDIVQFFRCDEVNVRIDKRQTRCYKLRSLIPGGKKHHIQNLYLQQ